MNFLKVMPKTNWNFPEVSRTLVPLYPSQQATVYWWSFHVQTNFKSRDWILGHLFEKRLESLASCNSIPSILADFTENNTLLWFYKSIQKIYKTRNLESIHEYHFVERRNKSRKLEKKLGFKKDLYLCPETSTKNVIQEFHLRL